MLALTPTLPDCTMAGNVAMSQFDAGGLTGKQIISRCERITVLDESKGDAI